MIFEYSHSFASHGRGQYGLILYKMVSIFVFFLSLQSERRWALPVERLSVEQLAMERAERKVKAALMQASIPGQRLLKEVIMGLVESREIKEDILLVDRQALGADDAATMQVVSVKRRLVELQVQ
jgi:hypothetical protein